MLATHPRMKNPPHITDLLNQRFGMLQVIEVMPWEFKGKSKRYYVRCKCNCGSTTKVETNYLRSGNKNHCGCIPQDRSKFTEEKRRRDSLGVKLHNQLNKNDGNLIY